MKTETANCKSTAANFRLFLRQELIMRTERNPRYSLRAFAKHLGVSAPVLSHLIAGKRPLSATLIQKLGLGLGISPEQIDRFVSELDEKRNTSSAEPIPFGILALDIFNVIADWYHDAILELTHISSFQPEPKWVARTLGITIHEVNSAIERLQRLELLEIRSDGKWLDLSRDNTTQAHPDVTSAALKKYQEKILELSLESLRNVSKPLRDHTSCMTAIDVADLDEVKLRIRNFRKDLSDFLQRDGVKPNQVYQLAIAYFPLAKLEKNI